MRNTVRIDRTKRALDSCSFCVQEIVRAFRLLSNYTRSSLWLGIVVENVVSCVWVVPEMATSKWVVLNTARGTEIVCDGYIHVLGKQESQEHLMVVTQW